MFRPCEKRAIGRTMPQDKGAEGPRRSHGAAQSECRTRSAGKWVVAAAGEESDRAERECEDAQFGEIQSQGEVSQATGWRRQLSAQRSILGRHTWETHLSAGIQGTRRPPSAERAALLRRQASARLECGAR